MLGVSLIGSPSRLILFQTERAEMNEAVSYEHFSRWGPWAEELKHVRARRSVSFFHFLVQLSRVLIGAPRMMDPTIADDYRGVAVFYCDADRNNSCHKIPYKSALTSKMLLILPLSR